MSDPAEPIIRKLRRDECTCSNEHPELDEFIAKGVNVHFEMLGQAQFWMQIDDPVSGRSWHINCGAMNESARGYARVEEIG